MRVPFAGIKRLLPWLVRFLAAGRVDRARDISRHMRALHARTLELYMPLVRAAGCEDLISQRGQLFVYEGADGPQGACPGFFTAFARSGGVIIFID